MSAILRLSPRSIGRLLMFVAAVIVGVEVWQVLGIDAVGVDFVPLRHAAQSLLAGESVFSDPSFVYPPTAALMLLPTAIGGEQFAFDIWVIVGVMALGFTCWLICRTAPARYRTHVAALALLMLLGGVVAHRSLFVGNMSELLVPLAAGVLLAFQRGRWMLGCALLAASLLIKPMLVPLVLIPVVHRRWRELAWTMLPAGTALLAAMLIVPGGRQYPAVMQYCLTGTNLHGSNSLNNLSLRGWAEAHHVPPVLAMAASVLVAIVVAGRVALALCDGSRPAPAWLGSLLLIAVFLAGAISEVHFLLAGLATILLHLADQHQPSPRLLYLPGLLLLGTPSSFQVVLLGPNNGIQSWLVGGELLLLVSLLLTRTRQPASVPQAPVTLLATAAA